MFTTLKHNLFEKINKCTLGFYLMGLCLFFLLQQYSVVEAKYESGFVYHVPAASLPTERFIEGAVLASAGFHNKAPKFVGQGFMRAYISPRIGIQGLMHHEYSGMGVHLLAHQFRDPNNNMMHYFGVGFAYSNIESLKSNISYPLINNYINYTVDFDGTRFHCGIGSNAAQDPSFVSFVAVDLNLQSYYMHL